MKVVVVGTTIVEPVLLDHERNTLILLTLAAPVESVALTMVIDVDVVADVTVALVDIVLVVVLMVIVVAELLEAVDVVFAASMTMSMIELEVVVVGSDRSPVIVVRLISVSPFLVSVVIVNEALFMDIDNVIMVADASEVIDVVVASVLVIVHVAKTNGVSTINDRR